MKASRTHLIRDIDYPLDPSAAALVVGLTKRECREEARKVLQSLNGVSTARLISALDYELARSSLNFSKRAPTMLGMFCLIAVMESSRGFVAKFASVSLGFLGLFAIVIISQMFFRQERRLWNAVCETRGIETLNWILENVLARDQLLTHLLRLAPARKAVVENLKSIENFQGLSEFALASLARLARQARGYEGNTSTWRQLRLLVQKVDPDWVEVDSDDL